MLGWKYLESFEVLYHLACQVIDLFDAIYVVAKELDAVRYFFANWKYIEVLTAHPESTALKAHIVAAILDVVELTQ